ncbi:MAG: NapC/NirT family cytochrome c [Gammaproteobacteria bacterium]|nr:NapC/NirT family cytochrome c [Gammaproteobacteria bacterium]
MFGIYRDLLTRKLIFGVTLGAAIFFMLVGLVFWGGFNTAMEATNNLEFCISCHEMKDTVYHEYTQSVHYKNRVGIRVSCPDCHVPREWTHKVVRKIKASNEVLHKIIGTINTAEKFNAKRLELATSVWKSMKQTDSRECRNCHSFSAMDIKAQQSRSGLVHKYSQHRDKTCIDCHKGIAHQLPEGVDVYRGGSDDDHEFYEKLNLPCYKCHKDMQTTDF